ncbi:MAG: GAF domain-containing protein [Dissulfurispiraceae bacterium]
MKEGELGKVYADGQIIFNEGTTGEVVYVVQSGKVKITKKTESGEVTIATLVEGELFGEMAVFDRLPRSATAVALGDARVLSVDKKKLFTTINRDPTLVFKMLESMSQRIRRLDGEVMKLKNSSRDVLHTSVDIDETCSLMLEEVRNLINADNGSIMLLDDKGKSLLTRSAFGAGADPKLRLSVGEGIIGDVLRTGKSELVNNVSKDSRFIAGSAEITSMLCVALRSKDHNFGVLNLINSSERGFTLDDVKLLDSLAFFISLAIQSAINFYHLTDSTNEMLKHATMLHM